MCLLEAAIQYGLAIGRGSCQADAPDHELAGARALQILRPLCDSEFGPHAQRSHVLANQFGVLPIHLCWLARQFQRQRLTVGWSRQPSPSRST